MTTMTEPPDGKRLRVLELYAGIGGMHCALNRCFDFSGIGESNDFPFHSFEVAAAVDVNEIAASVYRQNFPTTEYLRKGVEGFSLTELEALRFDMVTMSPPCQPFTRQGRKMDEEDARTGSFFHFLSILEKMADRGTAPNYIVVENVFGFETSSTHQTLIETLDRCGFSWREFLLTPSQFGIPNSRLRYYLIGKGAVGGGGVASSSDRAENEKQTSTEGLKPEKTSSFSLSNDHSLSPLKDVPIEAESFRHHKILSDLVTIESSSNLSEPAPKRLKSGQTKIECNDVDMISNFLDSSGVEGIEALLVPDKVLKRFMVMDITFPNSRRSCCFTKAYGRFVNGTGSFLQLNQTGPTRDSVYEFIKQSQTIESEETKKELDDEKKSIRLEALTDDDLRLLRDLRLRYFSPSEIARLHCLSENFSFPDSVSLKQRWKVLGNGLNAHVVSVLMRLLLQYEA